MTRRTLLVGIAALAASLGVVPVTPASPVAAQAGPEGAGQAAGDLAGVPTEIAGLPGLAAPGTAAGAPGPAGDRGPDPTATAAPAAGTGGAGLGGRYGGQWVEQGADGVELHVGVAAPTDADRAAVTTAARAGGLPADTPVVVDDVDLPEQALVAARDAVARELRGRGIGDFAVEIEPQANRVLAHVETDGPLAHALAASMRETAAAAATAAGDPGAPGTAPTPEVAVSIGSDVEMRSLAGARPANATPTTFPPYEAGLHVDLSSPEAVYHCTSAWAFMAQGRLVGSTAGHCGDTGTPVTAGPDGIVPVGTVVGNGFYPEPEVVSDTALYTLQPGIPVNRTIHAGPAGHRAVTGAMTDAEVTAGAWLCFAGRASGTDQCGSVNAVGRYTCCDATERAFVFTCTTAVARSGDSGGPVYQPVGDDRARAVGLLSSSVDIDGRSSMCFTTIDALQRRLGATFVDG